MMGLEMSVLALLLPCLVAGVLTEDDPLGTAEDYLKYDIKKGASLRPDYEAVGYWNGTVVGWEEEGGRVSYTRLFYFEGVNVRSVELQEDGSYISLSREVSVYKDLATGDILQAWSSIYTGTDNEVFEVANDPVNALLSPYLGQHSFSQHHTSFSGDFWLDYPNPLPPADYPAFSSGPQYRGGELFLTFARTDLLLDPATTEVGYIGSWSRVGPWLPWMERGEAPGGLIYSAPFIKLHDVTEVPEDLLLWMVETHPDYLHPPRNYTVPNMTSWRVFKSIIDQRREAGQPDIQVPEQPEWSGPAGPPLGQEVLQELWGLGEIKVEMEGSSYYVGEEGGQDMLWMEGQVWLALVPGLEAGTWNLEMDLAGWYGTPWPEKVPVSGGLWTNPEGQGVVVPYLGGAYNSSTSTLSLAVEPSTCSTMGATSDGWHYNILNCEAVLGQDLFLLNLYFTEDGLVLGGVTHRRVVPEWLDISTGHLVDRWLFQLPQV